MSGILTRILEELALWAIDLPWPVRVVVWPPVRTVLVRVLPPWREWVA